MLWVKSAWSDYYRGGAVDGNFGFLEGGNDGHDAWNFQAFKGKYMLHTIPQNGAAPDNDDKTGWTVICLAKRPEQTGIHIVGWYENATLEGDFVRRPKEMTKYFPASDDPYCYSIQSKTAYLVPPQHRTKPFSHPSIRSASYSYLSGPNVLESNNKKEVKALLLAELERLKSVAIKNPTPDNAPDLDNVFDNPLQGFGTAEHRKAVEVAAVDGRRELLIGRAGDVDPAHPRGGGCQSCGARPCGRGLERFAVRGHELGAVGAHLARRAADRVDVGQVLATEPGKARTAGLVQGPRIVGVAR